VARQTRLEGGPWWAVCFFWIFALLCFVVAMEEIAWGQQFIGYETPDFIKPINVQGEVTLHNYRGHNSALELVVFGVAMAGFMIYTHRSNIARMRAGTEGRVKRLWLLRPRGTSR